MIGITVSDLSAGGSGSAEATEDDDAQRLNVIREMIATERSYLEDLDILAKVHLLLLIIVGNQ